MPPTKVNYTNRKRNMLSEKSKIDSNLEEADDDDDEEGGGEEEKDEND